MKNTQHLTLHRVVTKNCLKMKANSDSLSSIRIFVTPVGFQPTTLTLEVSCSMLLSYGAIKRYYLKRLSPYIKCFCFNIVSIFKYQTKIVLELPS